MTAIYILVLSSSIFFWHHCTARLIGLRFRDIAMDIAPYFLAASVAIFAAWLAADSFANVYLRFAIKVVVTASVYAVILKITRSVIFNEVMTYLKRANH